MNKSVIGTILEQRPTADHSIEQYLMDAESMYEQLVAVGSNLKGKKVAFLGDDDHLSLFLGLYFDVEAVVFEIDVRVRDSLQMKAKDLGLQKYSVIKHDLRSRINYRGKFDAFVANPPYSSKNKGIGIITWLMRGLELIDTGGVFLLTIPIDTSVNWAWKNFRRVQDFFCNNKIYFMDIQRNIHTYHDVPNSLKSSNIWGKYVGQKSLVFDEYEVGYNFYR